MVVRDGRRSNLDARGALMNHSETGYRRAARDLDTVT